MNTLKLNTLIVAFLFGFSSFASASNDVPADKKEVMTSITKDVEKLLKNSDFSIEETAKVTVKIMINSKNEIVVLSVSTKNEYVDAFVKNSLNYKKVSATTASEVYILPIKLIASK